MGTDPAQDPGQGQPLHDQLHGFGVFAHLDELHVALNIDLRRAGQGAGGPVQLVNGEGPGHGLGITAVRRLAACHTQVEFIGERDRTNLGAGAAAGALGGVNEPRFFLQGDGKVSRLSGDAPHFGQGADFNVQVPPAFRQFGGNDAHGAVVGGEGLV